MGMNYKKKIGWEKYKFVKVDGNGGSLVLFNMIYL